MRRDVYSMERAKSFSDIISSAGNRFLPADVSARWKGNNRRSDIPPFISQHFDEDADAIYEPWRENNTLLFISASSHSGGVFKEISRRKPAPTLQVLVSGWN